MVLGIDLSLTGTGLVGLSEDKIVFQVLIKSKPTEKNIKGEMDRFKRILDEIEEKISKFIFDGIAIEGISFASSRTTSLSQLSGLNYIIRYNLFFGDWGKYIKDIKNFFVIPPTVLKKFISGKGNIKKELMLLETYKRYKIEFDNDNICDAYGLSRIASVLVGETGVINKSQEEVITRYLYN